MTDRPTPSVPAQPARATEAGYATVISVAIVAVLALLGATAIALGGVVRSTHQAAAAADLAALAGASTWRDTESLVAACAAASRVALANGAELDGCNPAPDGTVTVTVRATVRVRIPALAALIPPSVRRVARAGPSLGP